MLGSALGLAAGALRTARWGDPAATSSPGLSDPPPTPPPLLSCPQLWYTAYGAGLVFLLPFLPVLLDSAGCTPGQIGVIFALRPWLAAPCGVALSRLADCANAHTAVLVVAWSLSTLLRTSILWAPHSVALVAGLVLAADCVGSPTGTIVGERSAAARQRRQLQQLQTTRQRWPRTAETCRNISSLQLWLLLDTATVL